MKRKSLVALLFVVAAVYDGVLGVAFVFAPGRVFTWYDVTPPNHFGYVQFPGALLIVFALMFLAIAVRPIRNQNLIPFGILLKTSYCGIVFYHWFTTGIPDMWKPFAIIDFAFMILFVWAFVSLGSAGKPGTSETT